jgi:spermidine synthase
MPWAERAALRLAVFAAGALLMALEVAAFRIIGKTFGSALRETTTVIAVFLAAMSIGYWAGGMAADRRPRPSTLVYTLLGAAAMLLLVPRVDAVLSPLIASSSLALGTHAFLATSVLFAIPTVLLAATSPIAIRLFATSQAASGRNAGSVSALSTIGSIAGSLVTAFFLIDWLASMTRTVLFVAAGAGVLALTIVVAGLVSRRMGGERSPLLAFASLLLVMVVAVLFSGTRSLEARRYAGEGKLLFSGDSPYHHVLVRDRAMFRELQFDIALQTRMRRDDPDGPGLAYTDAMHLGRLLRPEIRRVLVIGVGGGTVPKQFLHDDPDVVVDAVEIDPLVVDVAKKYFGLAAGPRLTVHVQDGRTFLARSTEKWDLIIVDAYTTNRYGDTVPPHLVTREFLSSVASHLTPRGVLHFHVAFYRSGLMAPLVATTASVFDSVAVTDGEIVASNAPLIADRAAMLASASKTPFSRYPTLAGAISRLAVVRPDPRAVILTDDYAPVDTLLRRH